MVGTVTQAAGTILGTRAQQPLGVGGWVCSLSLLPRVRSVAVLRCALASHAARHQHPASLLSSSSCPLPPAQLPHTSVGLSFSSPWCLPGEQTSAPSPSPPQHLEGTGLLEITFPCCPAQRCICPSLRPRPSAGRGSRGVLGRVPQGCLDLCCSRRSAALAGRWEHPLASALQTADGWWVAPTCLLSPSSTQAPRQLLEGPACLLTHGLARAHAACLWLSLRGSS